MVYRYIVASGCSQSQNGPGTGGLPPTWHNPRGGCSYVDQGQTSVESPVSWVSHVARDLGVWSLVNMAAAGHGNQFVQQTIVDLLERYPYHPGNTLVLFNVTFSHRLDIPCDFRHPDRSTSVPWTADLLPYTYLSMRSKLQHSFHQHWGNSQVKHSSSLALSCLFSYLEHRKFHYRFTMAMNHLADPAVASVLEQYREHLVMLGPYAGIREFVVDNGLTMDACHPTVEGHALIAREVMDTL